MSKSIDIHTIQNSYRHATEFVIKHQNSDGSWCYSHLDIRSDSWTTAENLLALLYVKDDSYFDPYEIKEVCSQAVCWLINHQNSDGGWGCVYYSIENESVIAATSYVVIALDLYSQVYSLTDLITNAITHALNWIISTQKSDGGWSSVNHMEERSQIGCTSFALRAISKHNKAIGIPESIQKGQYFLTDLYDSGWKYSPLHEIDSSLTSYVIKMLVELEAGGKHNIDRNLIINTTRTMLSIQHENGTWSNWLGFSSSIEATALFLENYCLIVDNTRFTKRRIKKAIMCLLSEQKDEGSWGQEAGDTESSPFWITHNCIICLKCIANHLSSTWPSYLLKTHFDEKLLWNSPYRFDVVLSFAGEDREYVERIYSLLKKNKVKVFYDKEYRAELWGEDLPEKLDEIYRTDTKYCMIFCSKHYIQKKWTNVEKRSAKAAQIITGRYDYILPILIDNTEIPGILKTSGYIDSKESSPEDIVQIFMQKLKSFNE